MRVDTDSDGSIRVNTGDPVWTSSSGSQLVRLVSQLEDFIIDRIVMRMRVAVGFD